MAIAYDNAERFLTLCCNLNLNCAVVSAHLCGLSALSLTQQWASAAGVLSQRKEGEPEAAQVILADSATPEETLNGQAYMC